MGSSGRKPAGLAVQVVRLTFTIGLFTVLAVGTVTVVATSQLVSETLLARDIAATQLIEDTLLGRLAVAEVVATRTGRAVVANKDLNTLREELGTGLDPSLKAVRSLAVVNASLTPLAALPTTQPATTADARRAARAALKGAPGVTRGRSGAGIGSLWLAQTVPTRDRTPVVVLVEVDTDFMRGLLSETAYGGRTLLVVEGEEALAASDDTGLDMSSAVWTTTGPGSGVVRVRNANGEIYDGHFDQLEGVSGLSWRFVSVGPASTVETDTFVALWPTILVVTIGGIISLVMAGVLANRLVRPLKTLEVAALRAAGGAYVKPIDAKREDELGQVADAFNAVALRLNALHDLSQLLASSSQLDQVLDEVLSAMGHIVGPGVAAIYLLDDSGRWLEPVRARGADISLAPAIDSMSDMWLARALLQVGPSPFVRDKRSLAEELPGLVHGETAAIAAPLVAGHDSLGVVVALTDSDSSISEAELEMVRTFSAQAAVAVNNSRLFAIESESRRVAEGLRTIAERLVRPGGLQDALDDVELVTAGLFGADSAYFAVVDRPALGLPPAADREREAETLGFALRLSAASDGAHAMIVRVGDDAAADAVLERTKSRELIVAPVVLGGDHGAVLVVGLGDRRAQRRDLDNANLIANEVALALDNAYLFQQALSRATSLETVLRISQAVSSSLEVKVVLNRVLDVVQKILSADAVALMTYDARRRTIETEMARGGVSQAIFERVFKPGDDVVGYVFSSGEPVAFHELHDEMEGLSGDAARAGLHSMLAVPLLARGRSIGVLTAFAVREAAFAEDDTAMLRTFASQAALAIDTARLYSKEHQVASLLQASIVPGDLPEFEQVDAASAYEPAGGDAEIGGDYYDMFRAPDRSIWVAIADVCGKGVVAATKTSMIKFAVRSLVAAGFTPGRVVTEVNRMVGEGGDPSDIVTLWVGRIDRSSDTITWSSGGHPPGMLHHPSEGVVRRLCATGPLLGAVLDVTFPEETMVFAPGDTMILYTDGVTEARSGNSFFGESRVEDSLVAGGSASEVVTRLQAAVRRFVQAELRDDVAVLVVRLVEDARGESDHE